MRIRFGRPTPREVQKRPWESLRWSSQRYQNLKPERLCGRKSPDHARQGLRQRLEPATLHLTAETVAPPAELNPVGEFQMINVGDFRMIVDRHIGCSQSNCNFPGFTISAGTKGVGPTRRERSVPCRRPSQGHRFSPHRNNSHYCTPI